MWVGTMKFELVCVGSNWLEVDEEVKRE